jgi:hypothetical protein
MFLTKLYKFVKRALLAYSKSRIRVFKITLYNREKYYIKIIFLKFIFKHIFSIANFIHCFEKYFLGKYACIELV